MLKAINIRLYPNNEQVVTLNSLLGSYRFVYNQCLAFKKQSYESDKTNVSFGQLGKYFHGNLRNEYDWLKEHNTKVLKQSIINLDKAYKNFLDRNNLNSLDAVDHSKYKNELRRLKTIVTEIYTIESKESKVQVQSNKKNQNKKTHWQ